MATSAQCWYDRTICSWKSTYGRAHTPAVGAALNELAPAAQSPLQRGIHLGEARDDGHVVSIDGTSLYHEPPSQG